MTERRPCTRQLCVGLACLICLICACQQEKENATVFALRDESATGLNFHNTLTPTVDLNVFNYMYFYNGGGVAAADFNNDGLTDLYFTGNMVDNKLFLNTGDLRFRDVTDASGTAGQPGWTTGVAAVDINSDGLMDLYVGQIGEYRKLKGTNQLYICTGISDEGIPQYVDKAAEYGLDLVGFATQAAFFDYDGDGDLDMYQMNHSLHRNGTFGQRHIFQDEVHTLSGDKLMRNDDGIFVDVSQEAGIHSSVIGYGLGIAISDINRDGWPDIYIGNDFHENDYLYLNNQDGTFTEVLTEQIRHTSRFSMGVDIADINNDGYNEVVSLDMHPYDPFILKSSLGEDGYGVFQFKLGYGYNHQYARNALQLNNGNGTFSDIGIFAGVHATDWSWAPLFIDFDNDGQKDLFVSNGIPKRMNDIDYVNFVSNDQVQWKINMDEMAETDLALIDKLPEIKLPNKFFLNNGDLTFADLKDRIADARETYSNGAAYADFDNDGDLDIVVSNISDAPFIYENLSHDTPSPNHYLRLKFKGGAANVHAIGAKAIVWQGGQQAVYENYPVRGYQSSMPPYLHIGTGKGSIDSITIIWPDRTYQVLRGALRDTTLTLTWQEGLPVYPFQYAPAPSQAREMVRDISSETGIDYMHDENPFVEFNREQLIPHMTSSEGPALAVADINHDGQDDVFFGSSKHQRSAIYVQDKGQFRLMEQPAFGRDSVYEDVDAAFVDINGDGHTDLVVASGGNEFTGASEYLQPRAYLNDGSGHFTRKQDAFDSIYLTAACVVPMELNGDGHSDLFIGGRAVPWNYGKTPRSYLLANDGTGKFTDVTSRYAPGLDSVGLIKNATWTDIDSDGDNDLMLAMEWSPLTIFYNEGGTYSAFELTGTNGWWNFILPGDYDGDGDIDFVAGNTGRNSKLKPTRERPVRMYVNDFDDNGQIEQIVTYYIGEEEVLLPTFAEVTKQMPHLKKRFLYAKDFAAASLEELFGAEKLVEAKLLEVYMFESTYFENTGDRQFEGQPLPQRLQYAPLMTAIHYDFNRDGALDLLIGGNYHEANIELGRYDADYGNLVMNGGDGFGDAIPVQLGIKGQIRRAVRISVQGSPAVILARNNDKPVTLRLAPAISKPDKPSI